MSNDQQIIQRKWGYKTWFQFGADQLEFSFRDSGGSETGRTLTYENINFDDASTLRINAAKNFYFFVLGAGLAGTTVLQWIFPRLFYLYITPLNLSVLTCVVARCLNLITVKFTILQPASAGGMPIRIIHDEKHDEVLARIRSGWIARLRKLHLQIDVTNDAKTEARRFKWLLDHGVISDAEYQTAIARLSPDVSVPAVGGEQAIH